MSMNLDFLNQVSSTTEAAEASGYRPHPLGDYHGVIETIEQKTVRDRQVWELIIATHDDNNTPIGRTNYNIWGFSEADIMNAQRSQEERNKMVDAIARIKRLFTDLGIYTPEEAKRLPWASPNPQENDILKSLVKLRGRRCAVSVKTNMKDPSKTITFVNAPIDSLLGTQNGAKGPPHLPYGHQHGYQAAPQQPAWQAPSQPNYGYPPASPSNTMPPGYSTNDLPNIPF